MSNTATTETRTQYGIRKPNGDVEWSKMDGTGDYLNIGIEGAVRSVQTYDSGRRTYVKDGRVAMAAQMRAKAKEVGVPQEEFVNGHGFVTRQIITITMEPVVMPEAAREVQF
jgi:hypothetical protein